MVILWLAYVIDSSSFLVESWVHDIGYIVAWLNACVILNCKLVIYDMLWLYFFIS